jgi:nucleoside-diphosphate-sugar epimerase/predicted dehydrogenase
VALLGAGYIADYHLEALRRLSGIDIVAICDLGRARAERLASRVPNAAAFTDLKRLLDESRPDVVHVLTPPEAHFEPTRVILERGASAFVEKPLAIRADQCATLEALARAGGQALGTSHNFLFSPAYERLADDLAEGALGRIDQLDVVWNKCLPQVQFGPFGSWLFQDPRHILFEVAPHSFAHVMHVLGKPDRVSARAWDAVRVPGGRSFYRQWEVVGSKARSSMRLRFSFIDGYTEHTLHIRGSSGSAIVDFELNTYVRHEHSQDLLDFDRFASAVNGARATLAQAGTTLGSFVLSKAGLPFQGGPYQASISRAVATFYATRAGTLDPRLAPTLATETIRLAEEVARVVDLDGSALVPDAGARGLGEPSGPVSTHAARSGPPASAAKPTPSVLVLGGTGFIGRALTKRLRQEGLGVRALVRDTAGQAELLTRQGVELVKGDFTDTASIEAALDGITHVYHLARGSGRTWDDYLRLDVEPTRRLAELCVERRLALYYTSSIAIYDGGRAGDVINESSPASPDAMKMNVYARAKVENERILGELHRDRGLNVVIFRPGIVIGEGGSPYHWGVGAWPYTSICRVWGDGRQMLPFVLVDDCADAMVRALKVPDIAGESFNLVGDPCLSGGAYLDEFERIAGIKVKRLPTPTWRLFVEDIAKWGIKTIGRTPERRLPSYRYYEGLACRAFYSPDWAKQRLRWVPTTDVSVLIEKGIAVPAAEFLA